ncbi:hypothetical protein HY642_02225 [Candidatus Woesearchaeota archaeon]|nr:hypothetical protein [Candidatus Woesearchaeota archaeon]
MTAVIEVPEEQIFFCIEPTIKPISPLQAIIDELEKKEEIKTKAKEHEDPAKYFSIQPGTAKYGEPQKLNKPGKLKDELAAMRFSISVPKWYDNLRVPLLSYAA